MSLYKKLLLFIVLTTCYTLPSSNVAAEIKTGVYIENDRFTGDTTVVYSDGISLEEPTLLVQTSAPRSDILFQLAFVGLDGWRFLKCGSFHFLIDGKPKDLGNPIWIRDVLTGSSVVERATFTLQNSTLEQLAKAAKIEYKVCNDEYIFTPVQMDGLKEFVKTVTAPGTFPTKK